MSSAALGVGGSGPLAGRLAPLVAAAQDCLLRNVAPGRPGYLRAGGGYPDPWTRDAAINTWQAAAWLIPEVAAATLEMVCEPDGSAVVWDDQWWDQVIWLLGARELALVTGERHLAARGLAVGAATLARLDERCLDATTGLYLGPAVMADGITGYPPQLHEAGNASSFVLDHPATHRIAAGSTNALYALALTALGDLAEAAGGDPGPWRTRAAAQAALVRQHFWQPDARSTYLIVDGSPTSGQEGLGLALAILSGVLTPAAAHRIVAEAHREPYGLPAVWPPFAGLPAGRFGRHGAALWPMVMAVWAQAVAVTGDSDAFGAELAALCRLFEGSGNSFFEVYAPLTGEPDGGWQAGRDWRSEPDQTWSATGFLGTVLHGLAGLHPTPAGLELRPCLPEGADGLVLSGIPWRGGRFDLSLHGRGARVDAVLVDGVPATRDAPGRPLLCTIPKTVEVWCHKEEES